MEYLLMHEDSAVLRFNIKTRSVSVMNSQLLPITMCRKDSITFDDILVFCTNRVLMMNRSNCKEILLACGIENQTELNICLISRALSFRDNYWLRRENEFIQWKDVNLYDNKFSVEVAYVAITGKPLRVQIGDELFTGELTGKGTRPKCYVRQDNHIYLVKHETYEEIGSEILSFPIAAALGIAAVRYYSAEYDGLQCSICELQTSKSVELIPYRDIMLMFNEVTPGVDSGALKYVISIDKVNLIKMFLFDYLTLNTDRNRDNFGLAKVDGSICQLFPLYDHDSCFKGKSLKAIYFPTGLTFADTLGYLVKIEYELLSSIIQSTKSGLLYMLSEEFRNFVCQYRNDVYDGLSARVKTLLSISR